MKERLWIYIPCIILLAVLATGFGEMLIFDSMNVFQFIVSNIGDAILFVVHDGQPVYYETQSIKDYGKYIGNAEELMQEYMGEFFPLEITEDFEDVRYVFHSSRVDAYAFETYLEFTISSEEAFQNHVSSATEGMVSREFPFAEGYQEYVFWVDKTGDYVDCLYLNKCDKCDYHIDSAQIQKILVNDEENRIIYFALALMDGGGTRMSRLNTFMERFDIDPAEYEAYTKEAG